ncbi:MULTISPECIES: alkaline phosphatase PhoX [Pseudonocardia]|uniref:Alkaline phosphatase PhoX n=1 Tax=Pseudonocardia alni subsp. carboxydivorans TaxID=415010 RepID=A0ABU9ANG9_PSEA5|nr:alkaline phosphatase PhoX [Pseudonocardia sp. ICBG1034]
MPIDRRAFLRRSGQLGLGVAVSGPVHGLLTRPAAQPAPAAGYGPLVDDPKGMLALPEGFSYRVVTQAGKTRLYSDHASPGIHDGAAAFPAPDGNVLVVLNHEVRGGPDDDGAVPHLRGYTWREDAGGGCTVVKTTPDGELIWETVALAGTSTNCAGGVTPWGTWLTCEETDKDGHGYVFEVDPVDLQANRDPQPIKALGRFVHEACCVDPDTLTIYLTEDTSNPYGTVYRWTPPTGFRGRSGALKALDAGAGELAAMAAADRSGKVVADLDQADTVGTSYTVTWVPVTDRDAARGPVRSLDGITRAKKLEGAWWADHDGAPGAYLVSSFSDSHRGQIWHYDPTASTLTLTTVFAVEADGETVEAPDNIVAAPFGGLIVSTDGDGDNHLAGVTDDGTAYPIARSQMGSEFTGPTFSPDGTVLFAGIQQPGVLFAITGPWQAPAPIGRTDQQSTAGMSERSEETGSSRRDGGSHSPTREGAVG